jgi:hypothetical protein
MAEPEKPESPPEQQGFWRRAWAWTRPRRWWILLGLLFALVWWLVPPLLYRYTGTDKNAKLKAVTDTRTALLAGLVGVGALLTFWLNSRVYRITTQTLRVTEQGQITERYTKAIEQLGSDKLDVRLGGIYALESIARDSTKDREYREHRTIVEVLSAFIREHSDPGHTDTEPSIAKVLSTFLQGDGESTAERQADVAQPAIQPNPRTDVRAALTVLGRLPSRPEVPRPDLSNVYFADAYLGGVDLSGFKLIGANLSGAVLRGANLQGTNLWDAQLPRTDLRLSDLRGANLFRADLQWANLAEVPLQKANLEVAKLHGAELLRDPRGIVRTVGG